ncbi:hypothetical protein PHAVU_004G009101 [Phaseolus vulgaris]
MIQGNTRNYLRFSSPPNTWRFFNQELHQVLGKVGILQHEGMKEREEWECKTTSFPRLQHLSVDQCPKLKGLSEQLLHLKKLFICHCDKLIMSIMDTSSLELLEIFSCPLVNVPMTHYNFLEQLTIDASCNSLTIFRLDFFPKIRLIHLRRCQNLRRISQEHTHNHLKELAINDCPQFESFPGEGLTWECSLLKQSCQNPEGEDWGKD